MFVERFPSDDLNAILQYEEKKLNEHVYTADADDDYGDDIRQLEILGLVAVT